MSRRLWSVFLLVPAVALALTEPARAKAHWSAAGVLVAPVNAGNAFALSDGRVMSVAIPGKAEYGQQNWPVTTQIWSRTAGTWTATGTAPALPHIYGGIAVALNDGRILVTGYCGETCGSGSNAELFDPVTGAWTMPGQMKHGRYGHAMVKLLDGRVLVMGGCPEMNCMPVASAELFDPKTGRFTLVPQMHVHRAQLAAALLADGRVLVTGGMNGTGALADDEIYDPATNRWSPQKPMMHPHASHIAIALLDGRVLVAGGDCGNGRPCREAEIFDPRTRSWSKAGAMHDARELPAAALLPDGSVLVAGGLTAFNDLWYDLETAEHFDPASNKFIAAKPMAEQRADFSMATLPNGSILAVGGDGFTDQFAGDAELYTP